MELKRSDTSLRKEEQALKLLRPSQKAWHFKHARLGCGCFVVSLCPLGLSVWSLIARDKGLGAINLGSFLLPQEAANILRYGFRSSGVLNDK